MKSEKVTKKISNVESNWRNKISSFFVKFISENIYVVFFGTKKMIFVRRYNTEIFEMMHLTLFSRLCVKEMLSEWIWLFFVSEKFKEDPMST